MLVPSEMPRISPISTCVYPSNVCITKTSRWPAVSTRRLVSNSRTRAGFVRANELGGGGALDVDFLAVGPTTGQAPLRVRLRAINVTGVSTGGTFNFGDGGTATVNAGDGRAVHTYQVPGTYTVTLRVANMRLVP